MMNIIEGIGTLVMYGLAWLSISIGVTFILAFAFFGVEEVGKGGDNDDL